MSHTHHIKAAPENTGERLDKFLTNALPDLSRSRVQALIEQGCVVTNGQTLTDVSQKIKPGQDFTLTVPDIVASHIEAQDIPLSIVYEDEHLLVIDKPAGLTVHPAPGNHDNTLVNALLNHCGDTLSGIGGVARPGIVHRIDKDTSGLLVVAKHDIAHAHLSKQLSERTLKRVYNAVVWGVPKLKMGTIVGHIGRSPTNRQKMAIVATGGKEAQTHYKTLENFSIASFVECRLETGRTHQIRVHLTHIGHPLVGDPAYGQPTKTRLNAGQYKKLSEELRTTLLAFNRQALHARELTLIHPVSNKEMRFESNLPPDMQALLAALNSQ
jgi:23S rRNA pseudouridine1911/1915/1917 synthase